MRARTVYIVGAGPGDPSLISLRGRRYLAAADVVVYDHLVHPRVLRLASPHAECIDVGSAAPQPLAQDAINLLLAEQAREDKVVVRLKWGDPFVFDSGGKEALFLHEQGIPFEVVPGVSALVAGPAYAGVPLTYPGAGDTIVFVRGHEDGSNKPVRIDWGAVAKLRGTLVCYAGPRQLPTVADDLLRAGCPSDEWAAVVYESTLPRQRAIYGTLGEIADAVSQPGPRRQAGILVVGRAVGLHDHLRWFDQRPLFGKRVLVTRSREQAVELIEHLEDLGAEAIEAPSVRIGPPADFAPLDDTYATVGTFDWLVFTTANAADWFMRRLLEGPHDVRRLSGPRICAIGPATADRLARYGIKADLMPVEFRADAIVEALAAHGPLGSSRILVPRAEGIREAVAEELRKAGAQVVEVAAYRPLPEVLQADAEYDVYKLLLEGQIDIVLFTGATSVRGFVSMLGEDQAIDLLRTTLVACIGPVTAEAAVRAGLTPSIVPKEHTLAAFVQALVDHYAREAQPVAD
jgi:uroporphyrinogen III methyltransferase/synthase